MDSAFIQNKDNESIALTPWVITDSDGNVLYVVEPMKENGSIREGFYHVVEYDETGEKFVNGYYYELKLVYSDKLDNVTVQQTEAEAKKAISDYRMEKAILGVNEATATDEEQASSNVVELSAVANM
jgi:hypothetical protein